MNVFGERLRASTQDGRTTAAVVGTPAAPPNPHRRYFRATGLSPQSYRPFPRLLWRKHERSSNVRKKIMKKLSAYALRFPPVAQVFSIVR